MARIRDRVAPVEGDEGVRHRGAAGGDASTSRGIDGGRESHSRALTRSLKRLRGEDDVQLGLDVVDPHLREAWRVRDRRTCTRPRRCSCPPGTPLFEIELLAEIWRRSVPGTALVLAAWTSLGYPPSVASLGHPDLAHHVVPPQPPSRGAVERLRADLQGAPGAARISITELRRRDPAVRRRWPTPSPRCGPVPRV